MGSGEMAQQLRALTALPEDLRFNSQHPHDGLPNTLTQIYMQTKYQCTLNKQRKENSSLLIIINLGNAS